MTYLLPLLALIAAAPALAEGQRDDFTCATLSTCTMGGDCTEGGESFGLAFLGGGIEVAMNDETLTPVYDGTLRTAAWSSAGRVWQIRFTGDGAGVMMASDEAGAPEAATLMTIHCSPE